MSLRLRLTGWFVLSFTVVEFALLSALWIVRDRPDVERTHAEIRDELETLASLFERRAPALWTETDLARLALRTESDVLALIDTRGPRFVGGFDLFPGEVTARLITDGYATWTPVVGREEAEWERWPAVGASYPLTNGEDGRIHLLAARRARPRFDADAILVAAVLAAAGFVSAVLAAWVVLGRALRPLQELAASAREIGDGSRQSRLKAGGSEREVVEAREALNAAIDRLESGYEALDDFIRSVTHELRTPVATVLAEARQLLLRDRSDEEYVEFLRSTSTEMSRLGRMMDSLMMLARDDWEERQAFLEAVDLSDVIVDAARRTQPLSGQLDVRVRIDLREEGYGELTGDADLLLTMVENGMRTVLRAAPPGGLVALSLDTDESFARIAIVAVDEARDGAGAGGQEDEDGVAGSRVLLSGVREVELHVARRVAKLHGGEARTEEGPGGTPRIVFELPLTAAA